MSTPNTRFMRYHLAHDGIPYTVTQKQELGTRFMWGDRDRPVPFWRCVLEVVEVNGTLYTGAGGPCRGWFHCNEITETQFNKLMEQAQ